MFCALFDNSCSHNELCFEWHFQQAFHVEDFLHDILFKSLTIKSLHGRRIFATWEKAEEMLHQRKLVQFVGCCVLGHAATSHTPRFTRFILI